MDEIRVPARLLGVLTEVVRTPADSSGVVIIGNHYAPVMIAAGCRPDWVVVGGRTLWFWGKMAGKQVHTVRLAKAPGDPEPIEVV